MQSSESTSEQVGRSRQTRARAYTTSAATASRPVSYADENDVAGSFRRRPQPVGRSWRIFSWFARSRDDDDHGLLSSSSPSSAASPSLPSSSSDYHRHVGSGGNSGAHTISDASFVTAFSSSNQHNGNVRRRQPARPSVRSIWPTTDGFGHPSHMLRQKINSLSSVDSSTDLKRHLLRPWSAVEPMQSITVKSTDSNHFISQLASYSETTRIATSHLGMQSTVLTSKRSIPTLLNTNNSIRAKEQRQQQPRPLSSPSLLYGEDMMSRWREISPTLFDLHQGKAGLAKQQQQQQHTRRHLATLHARLSATRLALMIAASPRSSGNATMYQYSDLYPQTTMLPNNRPGQPLDLVKQQQQSVHPLKSTVKGSGKHYGGRRSRSSLYEDTTFRHVTRPNSYHGFAISSHRLSSSVRKYTSTVEAASLRFSSMNRRRWSDLRHSSPSRYHHHQSIDTSISTVKALPNATMIPSNTIARQLLQRSSLATSSSLMPNQRDKHLPINSNSSTLRTVSNVDSNSNEHATQLITPSLADELRMLIIGSWRRGFFNANAPSTFTHHHHHHHHQQQQQQRNPSMTSPSHSGSIRYRSIRRRRPRSNLYASRPISNVSAVSYVSSNNTDRWSQSEYGTLVQMEHFEGFDGA
ncbi:hypothetical protein BDF22DRAFT_147649 [Syncephalis plumigaleata]|nr:hypothetical protein BDF22DRAFT_147649 [Syncephalis plumigaleata]